MAGNNSLNKALVSVNISGIPDATPARENHRFRDHPESHPTVCAVKIAFRCTDENDSRISEFDVQFYFIECDLPFLMGPPSLLAMRASLNFKCKTLGIGVGSNTFAYPYPNEIASLFSHSPLLLIAKSVTMP